MLRLIQTESIKIRSVPSQTSGCDIPRFSHIRIRAVDIKRLDNAKLFSDREMKVLAIVIAVSPS